MENQSVKNKIISHPVTRIILGILVCGSVFIITQNIISKLLGLTALDKDYRNLFKGILASIAVIGAYKFFFKWMEKREVKEISNAGIIINLLSGLLIGGVLQFLTILVIYFNGGFNVVSINPASSVIIPLTVAFTVAIFEEILLRGIIFRIVEEKLGSYIALAVSAIMFGALHLANPNSSLFAATCIAIFAGLLFGAAYIYTRSLWFSIAIHFAWNFMQSGIFGAITSGNEKTSSLFTTQITGPELITGGGFGPEATIQAILFGLISVIILMYLNIKEDKLRTPYWKKQSSINSTTKESFPTTA